jgi:hypothetical protein
LTRGLCKRPVLKPELPDGPKGRSGRRDLNPPDQVDGNAKWYAALHVNLVKVR